MNIILVGPPGSGKGTQAQILTKLLNIPHISTGDIFRYNIKNNTELGKKALEFISKGLLVSDELTNELVRDRLNKSDASKGFILDGYPRNPFQASYLDKLLKNLNKELEHVIYINVPDMVVVDRISGRRVCKVCNHVDHINNMKNYICPKCGSDMIQRLDDSEEIIKDRLEVYKRETFPVLQYYLDNKTAMINEIDGSKTLENVTQAILGVLKK